jgi:hypothetical protein
MVLLLSKGPILILTVACLVPVVVLLVTLYVTKGDDHDP